MYGSWLGLRAHHDAFAAPALSDHPVVDRAQRRRAMVRILADAAENLAVMPVVKAIDRKGRFVRTAARDREQRCERGLLVVPARLARGRLRLDALQRVALGGIRRVEVTV